MAEIAGMFISPFLQVCFEKMASRKFVDLLWERELNEGLLLRLKMTLLSVNSVVADAEDKQFTNPTVKVWLDELKDAVYDAEDILDEIATEELGWKLDADDDADDNLDENAIVDLLRKLEAGVGAIVSKVRNPISTSFVEKVEGEIEKLLERLDILVKQKEIIGLRENDEGNSSEISPTTSLVEESDIFGRHDEKDAIINSLLSDGSSGHEMDVIAVVGMGGIGKTTLTQLVYNDNRLKGYFDLKAWVCVSDDFNVLKLTKTILEELELPTDGNSLNKHQTKLKEMLKEKKFLLVLDDVWNKSCDGWEQLSKSFKSSGTRVIVTTRDENVASVMHASATYRVNVLPKEDCWLLFVKHAFHNRNPDACLERKKLGRQIVEKCKGLPLAIKTIGSLLPSKSNKEWVDVLRSELWDLPIETSILPALGLSYKHLPPHLKRCFAYCSIFPKDYAFTKNTLVLLWMGEGLLPKPKNKAMEEVGDDYFLAFESRSLFQRSNYDKYIMHDLVSDLAKFISKQFTLSHEDDCSREIGINTRHFSYDSNNFHFKKFETFHKDMRLRTIVRFNLFSSGNLVGKLEIPMIRCLRVLILSHYANLSELPDSIGKFKLLRYLDVSLSRIKRLPDSICKLCNLQILNLSDCQGLVALPRDMHKLISLQILNLSYCIRLVALPRDMHKLISLQILNLSHCLDLVALPRDMHKLINLRHLNIDRTWIREMPINLGELKCLQTLSKFIVSKRNGSSIEELGKLTNLQESLSVSELQNVDSPTDAKGAKYLKDTKNLEELVLKWKVDTTASESHNIVLDSLEPHLSLKSLRIDGYGGTSFPKWVGDASFSNIASLYLDNCKFCCSLPPLGQLPSLHDLTIERLDGVVKVGSEFYGIGSSSMKPFGALKFLTISHMIGWEEWFSFEGEAFSKLEKLYISKCPKLTGGLPTHLPSLARLYINKCPRLVASLPRASSLCILELSNCNTVLLNESLIGIDELSIKSCSKLGYCGSLKSFPLFSKLRKLYISDCGDLESLTVGEEHEHDLLLSRIQIDRCPNFAYFPQGGLRAPNLKVFKIEDCRSLRSLPEKMHILLPSLEELHINYCPQVESFPEGGLRAPNLKEFKIEDCRSLRSLPEKMHILLPSLEKLYIKDCPQVESFPEGGLPSNLNEIFIFNCEKLYGSRMGWGLQNLPCVRRFTIGDKSEDVESFPEEGLLPASLTYLCIQGFLNLKSLDKKGLQHITALEELQICECPKLEYMPEDGLPSNLNTICILNCDKLFASRMGWGLQNLPCVRRFTIRDKSEDVESFPEEGLLPASLTHLYIEGFPNLKSLDKKGLQHITALEKLEILGCPKLECMPEDGLPASLSNLQICDCPLLKKEWERKEGEEWRKIAHVPYKYINWSWIQ